MGFVRCVSKYKILKHELTTAMQYQLITYTSYLSKKYIKLYNTLVRLGVDYRINPHAPPFKQTPANLFKFSLCSLTPQARHLSVNLYAKNQLILHIMSINSRYELLGSPILFDTYT